MALMLGRLYGALREAGASDAAAREAAEEVASYENQLAAIRSELRLIKWMLGFTIGLGMATLMLLLGGDDAMTDTHTEALELRATIARIDRDIADAETRHFLRQGGAEVVRVSAAVALATAAILNLEHLLRLFFGC
jgi:hypothetical protein